MAVHRSELETQAAEYRDRESYLLSTIAVLKEEHAYASIWTSFFSRKRHNNGIAWGAQFFSS